MAANSASGHSTQLKSKQLHAAFRFRQRLGDLMRFGRLLDSPRQRREDLAVRATLHPLVGRRERRLG
jgi:hypothetical protein